MHTILIKAGASSDYFGAYAENRDGIYGAGETSEAAIKDALKVMELFISSREKKHLPDILLNIILFICVRKCFINVCAKIRIIFHILMRSKPSP